MQLQSAANMAANRRRILITDKTRQSFHAALARMRIREAAARCERKGHSFMGRSRCGVCLAPNPAILLAEVQSEAA